MFVMSYQTLNTLQSLDPGRPILPTIKSRCVTGKQYILTIRETDGFQIHPECWEKVQLTVCGIFDAYNPVILVLPPIDLSCALLQVTDARDGQSRTIRQFQFTDWPEQGVPKSGEGFIDFIGQVCILPSSSVRSSNLSFLNSLCRFTRPRSSLVRRVPSRCTAGEGRGEQSRAWHGLTHVVT